MCAQLGSIEGYTSICEYSIFCNKPSFCFDPNPENSRGEWGPGADTARYGLDAEGQDGGIIYAKDGRAVLGEIPRCSPCVVCTYDVVSTL